jgi:hypothetical protein
MAGDRDRVIALLEELVTVNKAILQALGANAAPARSAAAAGEVASDRDLDSQYGNPEIRKDPKRWQGATMKGRKFSECPPEYLDVLAEFYDWQAEQAEAKREVTSANKPVAPYRRKDAARARGWAARIRAGKVHQAPREPQYVAEPGFEGSTFNGSRW